MVGRLWLNRTNVLEDPAKSLVDPVLEIEATVSSAFSHPEP